MRGLSLEEMAPQVPLVRFGRMTIIIARELAGCGLRLEPTGRNPRHYPDGIRVTIRSAFTTLSGV